MDGSQIIRDRVTRRAFLGGVGVALGGGVLLGCGGVNETTIQRGGIAGTEDDPSVLRGLLSLELTLVEAYRRGFGRPGSGLGAMGAAFLAHEQEHADTLTKTITDLEGSAVAKRLPVDFSQLRSRHDVLELWQRLESLAIARYIEAIPKLSTGSLRATIATIATCEAEHSSVLRGALGLPQAPAAFVGGRDGGR